MFRFVARAVTLVAVLVPHLAAGESTKAPADDEVRIEDESIKASDCGEIMRPRAKIKVAPKYPKSALKEGKRGSVLVSARLTREAKLVRLEVVESDDEIFNQPALDAVKRWLFEPARCDGRPIEVTYFIKVNFKLGP